MFPVLAADDARKDREGMISGTMTRSHPPKRGLETFFRDVHHGLVEAGKDWVEFAKMPVFLSKCLPRQD
jgi:hypothetical protein